MIRSFETFLQLLLITVCLLYLGNQLFLRDSAAQLNCNNLPQIRDNLHSNPYFHLRANTWINGTQFR